MAGPQKNITLACWDYDRARPVLDGRVPIAGWQAETTAAPPGILFPLAVGEAPYDVTELSFASYLIQMSRGESAYVAIPVYLSRAFRHGAIYVRTDAGIETAKDLEGRICGVPEYAMTLAVWVRGILADDYGVDVMNIRYRTAGLNEPGRTERLRLDLPPGLDVAALGDDKSLNQALLAGELDAIMAPAPPTAFSAGDPRVRRLIDPAGPAERDYYRRTGIFPIMHVVGVRKTLADANPGLAGAIYDAFLASRRIAMAEVAATAKASANKAMSPFYADAFEDAVELMGPDYWPYGVADNRAALSAICRYADAQRLTRRPVTPDELFHPETTGKSGC
ncbi:MAG: 4,5-dihydroxyphthalate decarboxylase [Proteobacteria bacterium]|nr:4,5-dihydroxyphthalate decarboxylase [Pseudomonadota bacterium]